MIETQDLKERLKEIEEEVELKKEWKSIYKILKEREQEKCCWVSK